MRIAIALLIGMIFGLGIAISGMANPAKVLNFFDFAGSWDLSLIFVMGGALVTTAIGYRLVFGARAEPVLEAAYYLPANRMIDQRLITGSAIFGIGWGISGFCPGGAIPALGLGYGSTVLFVGAMVAGIALTRFALNALSPPARA
ncbi:DUF6691 family protein [Hoeflea poritis]|uniref:YeeE/YedE family protein n=1 Tax=Hoeflea poritis TaxID=2993659 RepID=A0ABT4VQ82_9HYPH|nr:DUF6691 family protein [Hoeflea poritis]MDA4846872.1 YeeE/YedE family protein [Hoeflea poritis]